MDEWPFEGQKEWRITAFLSAPVATLSQSLEWLRASRMVCSHVCINIYICTYILTLVGRHVFSSPLAKRYSPRPRYFLMALNGHMCTHMCILYTHKRFSWAALPNCAWLCRKGTCRNVRFSLHGEQNERKYHFEKMVKGPPILKKIAKNWKNVQKCAKTC